MLIKIDAGRPSLSLDGAFKVRAYDDIIDPATYRALLDSFPDLDVMRPIGAAGHKDSFNDRSADFPAWLETRPEWIVLYHEIRQRFSQLCGDTVGVKHGRRVRFEFSSLPADHGGLWPHPDTAKKIATAVIYMEPDWNEAWGGGFEALRHLTTPDADFTDLRPGWDEVETILSVPVKPRRICFMQRTNNSLHGVRPLHSARPRRSLTVNLIG